MNSTFSNVKFDNIINLKETSQGKSWKIFTPKHPRESEKKFQKRLSASRFKLDNTLMEFK